MTLKEGNRIKNLLTGKIYEVKKINREWVLLQTEDGLSQALTGKMSLKFMHMWQGLDEEPLNIIPSIRGMGQKAAAGARR